MRDAPCWILCTSPATNVHCVNLMFRSLCLKFYHGLSITNLIIELAVQVLTFANTPGRSLDQALIDITAAAAIILTT